MKKKISAIILSSFMIICGAMPVQAAESQQEVVDFVIPDFETMATRASVSDTYKGNSYSVTKLDVVTCYCYITGGTSVQAVTACDGSTVTINSKSYAQNDVSTQNGSGGNANANSTSVTYTASSDIYYTAQVHSAVTKDKTVYLTLFRY